VLDALADRGLAESGDPNKQSLWQLSLTLRRRYPSIQVETNDRESILNLLRMNPTEGVSVGLIIDQCGMSRSSAKRLLGKLREEGLVQMIGKGANVRWIIDYRK
jgi:Fic family protein